MIDLFSQIKEQKIWMTELRRHFHQYPEPSSEEFKTAEKIEAELSALGIPHKRIGETGVLGSAPGLPAGGGNLRRREKVHRFGGPQRSGQGFLLTYYA